MLAAPRKPANGGSARPDLGAEPGSPGRQIPGSESAAAPPSGTSRPGLQLRWGRGRGLGSRGGHPAPPTASRTHGVRPACFRTWPVRLLTPQPSAATMAPGQLGEALAEHGRVPPAPNPVTRPCSTPPAELGKPRGRACRLCVPVLGLGLQSQVPSPEPGERRAKARE